MFAVLADDYVPPLRDKAKTNAKPLDDKTSMSNCERGRLHVPGFDGIPLDFEYAQEHRFAHGASTWAWAERLTACEIAMIRLMNDLTERPEWYKHIRMTSGKLLSRWRHEALQRPLINERTWNWCVAELHDKALVYGSSSQRLISLAIEPWNDILVQGRSGRVPPRIRTYGAERGPAYPEWARNLDFERLAKDKSIKSDRVTWNMLKAYLETPEYPSNKPITLTEGWEDSACTFEGVTDKWARLRHVIHPEPGISFSYKDWKQGQTGKAIIPKMLYNPKRPPKADPDHKYYRIGGIQLTPDRPSYDGDDWQFEGMLNEHIAAIALFFYDVHNITESRISFRQEASMEDDSYDTLGNHEKLMEVFDFTGFQSLYVTSPLQELGSVPTVQGRFLAWPNTLQYRVEPFRLADVTQSGHSRYIMMSLVDPHYRVCSTANVPPQQHLWWANDASSNANFSARNLPQEIIDQIFEYTKDWPIDLDEAQEIRSEMLEEHAMAQKAIDLGMRPDFHP
ncbi:hypothetical protein MMC25_000930 [Agyrium rufum]|nr:hypothetical protein [Agyrium rufum]